MPTSRYILVVVLLAAALLQATPPPGLKSILNDAEWQRAGLDRLTPDEVGVIDAALIRYLSKLHAEEIRPVPPSSKGEASAFDKISDPKTPPRNVWERFGVPNLLEETDWRKQPPLRAKVSAWVGGNRFRLENGQVWEGSEPIPYDLPGTEIEIQARPLGQFALFIEGKDTRLRIIRLR